MKWDSVNYWDREWQAERGRSLYEQRQKDMDRVEWWNRRAAGLR